MKIRNWQVNWNWHDWGLAWGRAYAALDKGLVARIYMFGPLRVYKRDPFLEELFRDLEAMSDESFRDFEDKLLNRFKDEPEKP